MFLLTILLLGGAAAYNASKTVFIAKDSIVLTRGILIRSTLTINPSKIAVLTLSRSPLDRLFGTTTLFCQTGSHAKKADFRFRARRQAAEQFEQMLFRKETGAAHCFSSADSAVAALSAISFRSGLLLAIQPIKRAVNLLSAGAAGDAGMQLSEEYRRILALLPFALDMLIVFLTVLLSIVFLCVFFRLFRFRYTQSDSSVSISSGFIVRHVSHIRSGIASQQQSHIGFWHRRFGRRGFALQISSGINKPIILAPALPYSMKHPEKRTKTAFRACFFPLIWMFILSVLWLMFSDHMGLYRPLAAAVLLILLIGNGMTALTGYRFADLNSLTVKGNTLHLFALHRMTILENNIRIQSIAAVTLTTNHTDRRNNTYRVKIFLPTGRHTKYSAKYLPDNSSEFFSDLCAK